MKQKPLENMEERFYLSWYVLCLKDKAKGKGFYIKYSFLTGEDKKALGKYISIGKCLAKRLGFTKNELMESDRHLNIVEITKYKRAEVTARKEKIGELEMKKNESFREIVKKWDEKLNEAENQEKCLEWYSSFIRSKLNITSFVKAAAKKTEYNSSVLYWIVNKGCEIAIARNLSNEALLENYKKYVFEEVA